jgi:hypothetical protein
MSDFELDIELLIHLMEARPMLSGKTKDIFKGRKETKPLREKCVLVLKKTYALDIYDDGTKTL